MNLTLDVLGLRPDGYHNLESVLQTISLHDTITVELSGRSGAVQVECDAPGIPSDGRNLAYKAAELLLKSRDEDQGVCIRIRKRIPPEAGLGGGSSNAAAVHAALSVLLPVQRSAEGCQERSERLSDELCRIGSDVPVFLFPGTSLLVGRGSTVTQLPDAPAYWLLVLKPPFGVSTAWAYRGYDEAEEPETGERGSPSIRMIQCLTARDRELLPRLLSNDLEKPVIQSFPDIGGLKAQLIEAGAKGSLMCGSGSAVFGLFDSEEQARLAEERLAGCGAKVFVARTVSKREASESWVEQ